MAKRTKEREEETFGQELGQMITPLNYQLNGDGTTDHPCSLLLEYPKDEPMKPIGDPLNSTKGGQ